MFEMVAVPAESSTSGSDRPRCRSYCSVQPPGRQCRGPARSARGAIDRPDARRASTRTFGLMRVRMLTRSPPAKRAQKRRGLYRLVGRPPAVPVKAESRGGIVLVGLRRDEARCALARVTDTAELSTDRRLLSSEYRVPARTS